MRDIFQYHEQPYVTDPVDELARTALTLLGLIARTDYTHAQRNRMDFAVAECVRAIREVSPKRHETAPNDDPSYIPF